MPDAEKVLIDWPAKIKKPTVGIIRDYEPYPRWTKCRRFLENNTFSYDFYDLRSSDWLENSRNFDLFIGILSSEFSHLQEMRKKFFILEKMLGKKCFPSYKHMILYEDKTLETYIAKVAGLHFAPTYIFNNKKEALTAIHNLHFPLISKIDPESGSMGVQWVADQHRAARIIKQAFSQKGRATQSLYFRQTDYVYFQDFVPNDGFDIRVIMVGSYAFGYYRKVPQGDFRASGMNLVEKRELPAAAIQLARQAYQFIKSPMLVVDMIHDSKGNYFIIEISPICQMESPEQLHCNGVPGAYIIENDGSFHFEPGKYWVYELAIKEYLLNDYLKNLPGTGHT
jgi:glutathione synthase/RimK-type ligase-like ATP-grasp enzyme